MRAIVSATRYGQTASVMSVNVRGRWNERKSAEMSVMRRRLGAPSLYTCLANARYTRAVERTGSCRQRQLPPSARRVLSLLPPLLLALALDDALDGQRPRRRLTRTDDEQRKEGEHRPPKQPTPTLAHSPDLALIKFLASSPSRPLTRSPAACLRPALARRCG